MSAISNKLADRAERKNRKRAEKRQQIAASAIEALIQLGYANTSMRDIASLSDMSLGMLHYYFGDKSDLIIYCVENYKSEFVQANEEALAVEGAPATVLESFMASLATSIKNDAASHRLWYDIRAQAMFDDLFHPVVSDIEDRLIGLIAQLHARLELDGARNANVDYAAIDGLFRYWIQNDARSASVTEEDIKASFLDLATRLWGRI